MLYGNLTHYYESNLLSQNTHIMSSELLICVIIKHAFHIRMCTFFYKTQVFVVTHSLLFVCLEIACASSVYNAAIHERGKAKCFHVTNTSPH